MRIQSISDDIVAMANIRRLRQEREKRGLTQLELSEKVGISSQAIISSIELGVRCKVSDYNKLAEYFNWDKYVPCQKELGLNGMNEELILPFANEAKRGTIVRRRRQRKYDATKPYVRISECLRKDLSVLATLQERTVSDIIDELLTDYIASYKSLIDSVNALKKQLKQEDKNNGRLEI